MDREEDYHEHGDDQERVKLLFLDRLARPGDKRLHLARHVERRRGLEDDVYLVAVRIDGDDIVRQGLVRAAMALVLRAVPQERLMKLTDMVLRQAHVGIRLEHEVHRFRVARHLLLAASCKGADSDVGKKRLDLSVRELRAFDARGRADALDRGYLAQGAEAIRRECLQGLPPAFELIDLCDEFDEVGAERDPWIPHDWAALYPISHPIIPDFTRFRTRIRADGLGKRCFAAVTQWRDADSVRSGDPCAGCRGREVAVWGCIVGMTVCLHTG